MRAKKVVISDYVKRCQFICRNSNSSSPWPWHALSGGEGCAVHYFHGNKPGNDFRGSYSLQGCFRSGLWRGWMWVLIIVSMCLVLSHKLVQHNLDTQSGFAQLFWIDCFDLKSIYHIHYLPLFLARAMATSQFSPKNLLYLIQDTLETKHKNLFWVHQDIVTYERRMCLSRIRTSLIVLILGRHDVCVYRWQATPPLTYSGWEMATTSAQ